MNKEIDMFEYQNVPNPHFVAEKIPSSVEPSKMTNYTDIKSIFTVEGKEIPVYHIGKGAIIYPQHARRGVLQNEEGLKCIKYLTETGKTKKNTTTGLTNYQALEHFHLYLDDQYRSYSKDGIFSTYSRLAKRTPKSKK